LSIFFWFNYTADVPEKKGYGLLWLQLKERWQWGQKKLVFAVNASRNFQVVLNDTSDNPFSQ